jgi:hypothetical protein
VVIWSISESMGGWGKGIRREGVFGESYRPSARDSVGYSLEVLAQGDNLVGWVNH